MVDTGISSSNINHDCLMKFRSLTEKWHSAHQNLHQIMTVLPNDLSSKYESFLGRSVFRAPGSVPCWTLGFENDLLVVRTKPCRRKFDKPR